MARQLKGGVWVLDTKAKEAAEPLVRAEDPDIHNRCAGLHYGG